MNKARAQAIAKQFWQMISGCTDWEVVRDLVDQVTGNELDCFQLDTMTDWVLEAHKRLVNP